MSQKIKCPACEGRGETIIQMRVKCQRCLGHGEIANHAAVKCPECGNTKVWKNAKRYTDDGRVIQRYLCTVCSYRFSWQ